MRDNTKGSTAGCGREKECASLSWVPCQGHGLTQVLGLHAQSLVPHSLAILTSLNWVLKFLMVIQVMTCCAIKLPLCCCSTCVGPCWLPSTFSLTQKFPIFLVKTRVDRVLDSWVSWTHLGVCFEFTVLFHALKLFIYSSSRACSYFFYHAEHNLWACVFIMYISFLLNLQPPENKGCANFYSLLISQSLAQECLLK